ncbi:MAG: hypothetical protein CL941_07865 [Desulfobacter sp.]|nr:hypothetical protein [Desulfobacter sp.]
MLMDLPFWIIVLRSCLFCLNLNSFLYKTENVNRSCIIAYSKNFKPFKGKTKGTISNIKY